MALAETFHDPRMDALEMAESELRQDCSEALDFITAEFEASRAKAQRYYNGESDLQVDANRSRYVATKVRDTVRSVRPSLMRVFASCDTPVSFVPATVAQGMIAEAQTKFISQLFDDLGGYKQIYSAFHSAMLFKLGVVKYWYDDRAEVIHRQYTGLSEQHVQMLTAHPGVEVIAAEEQQMVGPQGIMRTFDLEVVGRKAAGEIKMEFVPLTEFIVDRNATCKEDARLIAHRRNVTRGDAVAMGFDEELLEGLNSENPESNWFSGESFARRGYTVYPTDDDTRDESMQDILLTEAYARFDLDGVGIPQMYRFYLGGTNYKLLDYERVDKVPFALFAIDPEPGALFGKSLFDVIHGDQDVMTSITRASVDNFHMTNNPRLAVHEHMVNMEDVLNNDLGSPIRVRSAGQIQVIDTPFTGAAALPLLEYMGQDVENKTGVTRAAAGLDPDAMQSTDKDAVKNTIQLAQGQVELMARNLAESGMKDLFEGLLELSMTHLDTHQILRQDGQNQPVRLDVFDPTMKMRVEVGIGTGSYEERMTALNEVYGVQKEVLQTYGPGNPVVSLAQMQNTLFDKLKMAGIHNPLRYFNRITPQQEQALAKQMQEQSQKKEAAQMQIAQTQAGALQQAEQIKGQVKMTTDAAKNQLEMAKASQKGQIDMAQLQQKSQSDFTNLMVKDDLARDQMMQDMYLTIMEMRADMAQAGMIRRQQATN